MYINKNSERARDTYFKIFGEEACGKRGVAKKHYQEWLEACVTNLFRNKSEGVVTKMLKKIKGRLF